LADTKVICEADHCAPKALLEIMSDLTDLNCFGI